jgi:hypothetical protein
MVEFTSIKHEMKRNIKYQSMINFTTNSVSLPNKKKSNLKNLYFNENIISYPYQNKRNKSNIPFLNSNKSNHNWINKNISFLKFIQNNPHKVILAKILIDKMKKENNFYFSKKSRIKNSPIKLSNKELTLFGPNKTMYSTYNNNKKILIKNTKVKLINDNFKEEKNKEKFFPFKNEFIREQIKKSIISFDSKSKF